MFIFQNNSPSGALDQPIEGSSCMDLVDSWSIRSHQSARALIGSYYGSDLIAQDASRASDDDPTTAIKNVL